MDAPKSYTQSTIGLQLPPDWCPPANLCGCSSVSAACILLACCSGADSIPVACRHVAGPAFGSACAASDPPSPDRSPRPVYAGTWSSSHECSIRSFARTGHRLATCRSPRAGWCSSSYRRSPERRCRSRHSSVRPTDRAEERENEIRVNGIEFLKPTDNCDKWQLWIWDKNLRQKRWRKHRDSPCDGSGRPGAGLTAASLNRLFKI